MKWPDQFDLNGIQALLQHHETCDHVMLVVVEEISRTKGSRDAILSNVPSGRLNFPKKVTFLLIQPS